MVVEVLDRSAASYEAVLGSALVTHEEKSQIVDRIFAARVSPLLLDFLKVVVAPRTARHRADDCRRSLASCYDELRGRIARATGHGHAAGRRLAQSLSGSLQTILGGRARLSPQVDPELIGGVVLRVGDTVYDGSVATAT